MLSTRKPIRSLVALVSTGILIVASGASTSTADAADAVNPAVLAIQVGDDVTFADGRLSFTSSPSVHWFSDRPDREVGSVPLEELTSLWEEGMTFSDVPPNAAVVIDAEEPIVMDLIDIEVRGDVVTYDTQTLLGTAPATGDRIILVIDHYCMANPSDC